MVDVSTVGARGLAAHGGPIQVFFTKGMAPRPVIERASGIYMWDREGRRYIDASSGPVASNLGHGNARVLEAMRRQAERVAFAFPGVFESEANRALADLVTGLAGPGLDRAFFVSGGSEATEACVRLARQYAVSAVNIKAMRSYAAHPLAPSGPESLIEGTPRA